MSNVGLRDWAISDALSDPRWLAGRVLCALDGYPDKDSCWTWTRATNRRADGYGIVYASGVMVLVHRAVWIAHRGPIDPGLVLDHDGPNGCGNRRCANPCHIQAVTQRHNVVVSSGSAHDLAARTHCPAGHELAGDNLRRGQLARGWRACRACGKERNATVSAAARALHLTRDSYRRQFGGSVAVATAILEGVA